MSLLDVQYISCINEGGFIINFSITYQEAYTAAWQSTEWNSGNILVGQYRVSPDLAAIGVPTDAPYVLPIVWAVAGGSSGDGPVQPLNYAANGQAATYVVTGTSFNIAVNLIQPNTYHTS